MTITNAEHPVFTSANISLDVKAMRAVTGMERTQGQVDRQWWRTRIEVKLWNSSSVKFHWGTAGMFTPTAKIDAAKHPIRPFSV